MSTCAQNTVHVISQTLMNRLARNGMRWLKIMIFLINGAVVTKMNVRIAFPIKVCICMDTKKKRLMTALINASSRLLKAKTRNNMNSRPSWKDYSMVKKCKKGLSLQVFSKRSMAAAEYATQLFST